MARGRRHFYMADIRFPAALRQRFQRQAASPPGDAAVTGIRRVMANFAHLVTGKAAAGVVSAIYLLIITRALGAHGYGVLILVNAYVVLVGTVVAYCGFHGVVRYGAIVLEAGDRAGFARIVRYMGVVELVCGAAAITLAALLAPLIGPKLGWSDEAVRFAVLYSLAVIAQIRATPQGVLQLAQRFDLISAHQIVLPGMRLIGATVVWGLHGGLMGYLAVWLTASVVEGLAMWLMALGSWRKLAPGEPLLGPWRGVSTKIEGFGRFAVITKFEITLRELAPKLAPLTVGWVLGPAAAGVFALALRGTSLLAQPAGLLSRAIYPVLAAQNAKREMAPLWRTVWRAALMVTIAAVPIVLLLAVFGRHLLPALGGSTFAAGSALVVLIALSRTASLAGAPIAAGLIALGRPQRSMIVALAANVGLYPLLPLMMWKLGVNGAGWHALLQCAAATLARAFFVVRDGKVAVAGDGQLARREGLQPAFSQA